MAGFSSCYFCGTALDASVDDRPVVPDDLAPSAGSRRTVTLCPTCNRKLDAVMDEVREAVRSADDLDLEPKAESGGAGDDGGADPSAEEFFDESPAIRDLSDRESEAASEARDAGRGTETDAARSSAEGASDDGASDEKLGAGEAVEGGDGEAAEEGEEDNQSITALENSKVMRMLENREFPVERAPFETVAANAYEVRPSDVGKVIDMAIDRGLLAEEDGTLVRPE